MLERSLLIGSNGNFLSGNFALFKKKIETRFENVFASLYCEVAKLFEVICEHLRFCSTFVSMPRLCSTNFAKLNIMRKC